MLRKLMKIGPLGHFQILRTIYVSSVLQIPRNFGQTIQPNIVQSGNDAKDDLSTIAEVESSLFANNEKQHKPVSTKELLKQYKPEARSQQNKLAPRKEIPISQKPIKIAQKKESSPIVKDTELGLQYIKLSLNDPLLARLMLTAKSRKRRDQKHQIVVEGRRLILEAIECQYKLQSLLFSQKKQLAPMKDDIKNLGNIEIIKVPQHDLRAWSTLSTCPGLIAILDRPSNTNKIVRKLKPLPITVICDNIREPNNLGSIIRSCAAIPCTQVLVLKGCCDPWDTKALRGGCGGQFRVPIKDNIVWEELNRFLPDNFSIFVAENNLGRLRKAGEEGCPVVPYTDVDVNDEHNVVVIGGETYGISDDAFGFLRSHTIGSCVHIPLAEGVESLNTASALTLIIFEMRKLMLQKISMGKLQQESIKT